MRGNSHATPNGNPLRTPAQRRCRRRRKSSGNPPVRGVPSPFTYARDEEIYGEGEEAEYVYKIVSGAVRSCKILSDGRRQINGFYLPGDLFGFEQGDMHRLT